MTTTAPCISETTNPVAIGGARPRIDKIEQFVHSPRRVIRDRFGKDNHDDPTGRDEAVSLSQQYLSDNGLNDVAIDVRRYEPVEQWQRLRANDRLSPFWKYTAGTLDVASYAMVPRRALHSDNYSPFTNTLSINSTDAGKALFQAARAKECHKQRFPGIYAVLQRAPVVGLVHHSNAASDALTYANVSEHGLDTCDVFPAAYAQLGSEAFSDAVFFAPLPDIPFLSPIAKLTGRITGRAVGQFVAEHQSGQAEANMEQSDTKPSQGRVAEQLPQPAGSAVGN